MEIKAPCIASRRILLFVKSFAVPSSIIAHLMGDEASRHACLNNLPSLIEAERSTRVFLSKRIFPSIS